MTSSDRSYGNTDVNQVYFFGKFISYLVYTKLKKRCRVKSINHERCDPKVYWEVGKINLRLSQNTHHIKVADYSFQGQ